MMGMMTKLFVFFAGVTNMFRPINSQASCLGDIDNNLSVDVNDLLDSVVNDASGTPKLSVEDVYNILGVNP